VTDEVSLVERTVFGDWREHFPNQQWAFDTWDKCFFGDPSSARPFIHQSMDECAIALQLSQHDRPDLHAGSEAVAGMVKRMQSVARDLNVPEYLTDLPAWALWSLMAAGPISITLTALLLTAQTLRSRQGMLFGGQLRTGAFRMIVVQPRNR
jgi:hypothetical protein